MKLFTLGISLLALASVNLIPVAQADWRGGNNGWDHGGGRGGWGRGGPGRGPRGPGYGNPGPGYGNPGPGYGNPGPVYPQPIDAFVCLRVSQKGELALGRGRTVQEASQQSEYGARYAQAEGYICGPTQYRPVTCELVKTDSGLRFYGQGNSEAEASMQAFQSCGNCHAYAHARRCY